jgi:hypothetical protein
MLFTTNPADKTSRAERAAAFANLALESSGS